MGDDAKRSPLVKFLKHIKDQFKNDLNLDTIVTTNKELMYHYLPAKLAFTCNFIFCWFIAHVRILMALVTPIAAMIPQQRGNWKLSDAFSFFRSEFTIILLALSAFFHFFAIPAYLKPFNWAFTLRPQINVKPRMTMVAKKSQSDYVVTSASSSLHHHPEASQSLEAITSTKSKSLGNLAEINDCDTDIDFGLSLKVRDGITDKFLSLTERAIDTFSIASTISMRSGDTYATSYAGSEFSDFEEEDFNFEEPSKNEAENFVLSNAIEHEAYNDEIDNIDGFTSFGAISESEASENGNFNQSGEEKSEMDA
uniref:Uncharacterized protein n=1 Tax=Panagrolaimus sp. PS1159 TaxID=55785 RepID=A0AC35G4J7_9BILA